MVTKINTYDPDYEILRKMQALEIVMKLEECGFKEEVNKPGVGWSSHTFSRERIFSRPVNDRVKVKVYTSVVDDDIRKRGKDAIRVCAVYTTNSGMTRGIVKTRLVHRTGNIKDIVDRMHQRMRDVWRDTMSAGKCTWCGSPMFISKKKNLVCAEACWIRRNDHAPLL